MDTIPQIFIHKHSIPVIYLDTNILIELARFQKGKCVSPYYHEIETIHSILTGKMQREEILCPLGNQLVEMGISEGRSYGRDFLYQFTNSKLLPPCEIERVELDIAYKAFIDKSVQIELKSTNFFDSQTFSDSLFVVHAAPVYKQEKLDELRNEKKQMVSILNEMKRTGMHERDYDKQLAAELSADSQLLLDAFHNPYESEEAFLRYLNTVGIVYSRTGINHDSSIEESCSLLKQYYAFLNSNYHHNIPYVNITASLWAYRMQRSKEICDGDRLDTIWAASYLPFVDYAITDTLFCKTLNDLNLPAKYDTNVYSFRNLQQFIDDIR